MLIFFEAIIGLKVNLNNSEVVPIGDVGGMEELVFFFFDKWYGGVS